MIKKIFSVLVLLGFVSMPIFGVEIPIPTDKPGDDINMGTGENGRVSGDEKHIFRLADAVNTYLWRSFGIVCTAAVIYGGYELITANGDKQAMKKAQWALIGSGIGICIAMLAYTFVHLLANLM